MPTPRKHIFDPAEPTTCHCISRCVRRARLLEQEERRLALAERLAELVIYFAIDILEWALLTNHFHLVASTHPELVALWSDREVATRWRTLSPDYAWRARNKVDTSLPAQPEEIAAALADPALVARWRRNLADLSTFHKFLKQKIARIINLEDDVTGHCWEGRFKSIVALDEEAVVAHMVYVALNPVRAHLAEALDGYGSSSIARRVEELRRRIAAGEFAGEAEAAREKLRAARLVPALPCDPGPEAAKVEVMPNGLRNPWFGGRVPSVLEGASLAAFIADVDAAGRVAPDGRRGVVAASAPRPLAELDRALLESARGACDDRVAGVVRDALAGIESAMSRGLASPLGNFSGGAAALARKARETGRKFVLAVAALVPGAGRRVAAERAPPAAAGEPRPAVG